MPDPIGRGWGGRTVGKGGVGGLYGWLVSIVWRASGDDGGCVRKGIGEGRVEGTGVAFDPAVDGEETRRLETSTRDRFISKFSSELGLSGLF